MSEKNFEKLNIKPVINVPLYSLQIFGQFEKIQIMGPNLPKKAWVTNVLEK